MNRWRLAILGIALALAQFASTAGVVEFDRMQVLRTDLPTPPTPPGRDQPWDTVALPDSPAPRPDTPHVRGHWYHGTFEAPGAAGPRSAWAVYLPFLYGGGEVWVNGVFVGAMRESSDTLNVRWERPHLVTIPSNLLRAGANDLDILAAVGRVGGARNFPRVRVGPEPELRSAFDLRIFWVRTMPQITVVVCLLVSVFVLFIWWRRRGEVLYGLFGLATALWGIRTLTFVIEQVPAEHWVLWRTTYLAATGGFIVVMAIFSLRYAGLRRPWAERALVAYWAVGPVLLLAFGAAGESWVNQYWSAGLIPIGLSILLSAGWFVWKQRTLAASVLPAAMAIAVLAGVHDYLVAWNVGVVEQVLPVWSTHRLFLLHHGANVLLLAMGGLLTARFVQTLGALEDLNQTLESRVDDRERHLAANFERLAVLQQQHAASQERQLIMREIHDGLGSRLFTSLSRVERGDMDTVQIADALRACIADMRLALDALTPDDHDFRTVLGNFLFRWQSQLEEARVQPAWVIDVPDNALALSPQSALQLLRIAQEALTNVLKHARAARVEVRMRQSAGQLTLEVIDDGCGNMPPSGATGRGLHNMRARARQLGGQLQVRQDAAGTRVTLQVPIAAVAG